MTPEEEQECHAISQHALCCKHLDIAESFNDPGDTLFEAIVALRKERDDASERLAMDILRTDMRITDARLSDAIANKEGLSVLHEAARARVSLLRSLKRDLQARVDSICSAAPPPADPRFARFGEAMWKFITKNGSDFCGDELSEDILPLAQSAGLCCRVEYDPETHGEGIEADPGDEIWWWGLPHEGDEDDLRDSPPKD